MGTATTTHVNMDNLMNMGKQAYSAYQSSQAGEKRHEGDDSNPYGVTGSERLNSSDNRRPGGDASHLDGSFENLLCQTSTSGESQCVYRRILRLLRLNEPVNGIRGVLYILKLSSINGLLGSETLVVGDVL